VTKTALVTGATAGIGAAFARRLAAEGYDLVLVARDAARLGDAAADLAKRYDIAAEALPADLSTPDGCAPVEQRLRDEPFDVLVNNAGLGLNISFLKSDVEQEERLLHVNVHAVMRLTLAVLPGMVERRHGGVVNVSSYPASKAWVTSFSESVGLAARPYGVRVLAVHPGYTRTEFHQRAGINLSKLPGWLWLDADKVAADGLRDLYAGRTVSVPDWKYKAAVFALRHAPRSLIQLAARDARGRVGLEDR